MTTSQDKPTTTEKNQKKLVDLRELVAALDRRIPQIERQGEHDIARDSAALKKKAEERIAQLETETPPLV